MTLYSSHLKAYIFALKNAKISEIDVLVRLKFKKVGLKSYKLKLPLGCRLHPVFHCDLLSIAYNPTPWHQKPSEIESNHNEYAIDHISDVKIGIWPNLRGFFFNS